jgi:hypothetical protein
MKPLARVSRSWLNFRAVKKILAMLQRNLDAPLCFSKTAPNEEKLDAPIFLAKQLQDEMGG